ncbi:hypothetical protein [Jannaschia formosa]|uniref:hypothetical protein n=1 Tax=Jannaschia formosa TaxID=2259592 RepID=UPI000E1BAB0B|nr:hypothetical protein [Jannaschia formosa]TFL18827.1 hypothetical protein DR046_07855 [Jannaschia formosa]
MPAPLLAPELDRDRQPPLIALLRFHALACRTSPRAGLTPEDAARAAAVEDMALLLARMLPVLLLRRPVLWRPGTAGRSFDEDWLLALARALRAGDADSARFLLTRRARPEGAATLRMLVGDLAERLDTN